MGLLWGKTNSHATSMSEAIPKKIEKDLACLMLIFARLVELDDGSVTGASGS